MIRIELMVGAGIERIDLTNMKIPRRLVRAAYEVRRLPKDALVEIEAVAGR